MYMPSSVLDVGTYMWVHYTLGKLDVSSYVRTYVLPSDRCRLVLICSRAMPQMLGSGHSTAFNVSCLVLRT